MEVALLEMDGQLADSRMEDSPQKLAGSKSNHETLEAIMIELAKTKADLAQARETTMQSWLDSKPFIDELERLQSALTRTRNRASMAAVTVSTLETQLESTDMSTRAKEEGEHKARMTINELNQALDQTHAELEKLKCETDDERRARAKIKQELRLRRQSLRTLRLMQRAIRIESEAFEASASAALHHIEHSKTENAFRELTYEDYDALTRKANEEASLADWRVSVSMEQKRMAEASREQALRRLAELYKEHQLRKVDAIMEEEAVIEEEGKTQPKNPGEPEKEIFVCSTSAQKQQIQDNIPEKFTMIRGNSQQRMRRSKSSRNKKLVKKKKSSILHQIQSFLVRHLRRIFG